MTRLKLPGVQDWQYSDISAKECPVNTIGSAHEDANRTHSLARNSCHGSGAVELSPCDLSGALEHDPAAKPSGMNTRSTRMAELQSQQPSYHTKSKRRSFVRNGLARAGSNPLAADQPSQSDAVPTFHGLTGAPGQLQAAKRITDMFRTKRPSNGDLPRTSKKTCVRPTLSAAFCSPFAQEPATRKNDFYSVSSQMVSAFNAPCQQPEELSQENVAACDRTMKTDDMVYCDEMYDMMPCGMAPMPHSPMCNSEPIGFAAGLQMASAGAFTPAATTQLGGRPMLAVSPSVHTPPERMAVVPDQPPGAPRKRSKSSSSSMSADSFDACESVFAPGAPDWSPCNAVCRVLKFDDDMDE